MLAKLAAVTLGDVWSYVWRGIVWGVFVVVVAMLLDVQLSWRMFALLGAAQFADAVLCPRKGGGC